MRQAVLTFTAALLGVLIAQFAFYFFEKHQAKLAEAAIDAELQAKVEQGRKLAEQTIVEQRAAQVIREGFIAASGVKAAVAEYYMSTGQMPANNSDLGLGDSKSYRGESLLSMEVVDGGKIILVFDSVSGVDRGTIELTPDLAGHESMGVQWQCATSDFVNIARAWQGSGCEFIAPEGKQATTGK